jgi:hypothetical protein
LGASFGWRPGLIGNDRKDGFDMRAITAGLKLKSSTCGAQVMVLKGIPDQHELQCGGAEMISVNDTAQNELNPELAGGTLVGKRYVNEDESLELLCIKEGVGTLCLDGEKLRIKQPKALPSSD